jgi:hypothetical protein
VTCKPLVGDEHLVFLRSDERGRFWVRGLAPGTVNLQARSADAQSEPLEVQVVERGGWPATHLVVRKLIAVSGAVHGPLGAVVGAEVVAFPIGRVASPAQSISGVDGTFELHVPAWPAQFMITVVAPGFAFRHLRVDGAHLRAGGLSLEVESAGGTLIVAEGENAVDGKKELPFIVHDGLPVPWPDIARLQALSHIANHDPGTMIVPSLEPGDYAVCRVPIAEATPLFACLLPPTARCSASTFVTAGGQAVVTMPPPK